MDRGMVMPPCLSLKSVDRPGPERFHQLDFYYSIIGRGAQEGPEVQCAVIVQACFECALGGHTDAVACTAKCSAERSDDSDLALMSGDGVMTRRREQRIVDLADIGIMLAEVFKDSGVSPV